MAGLTSIGQLIAELERVAAEVGADTPVLFEEDQIGETGLAAVSLNMRVVDTFGACNLRLGTHWIFDEDTDVTRAVLGHVRPERKMTEEV